MRIELVQPHPFGGQPSDVWRQRWVSTIESQLVPTHVVGKDKDDIWASPLRSLRGSG